MIFMRIALLGSSGMLGSKVALAFGEAGHTMITPSRQELSLADEGALERFYQDQPFDGVINCAAFTAVDACEDPAQYPLALRINGTAVGKMARLSQSSGRWLIHLSTDYVFNGKSANPYREEDPTDPVNAYGKTKLEGEWLFHEAGEPGWMVRTSWMYGPHGRHFVKTMAGLLRTKDKVEVVNDQIGGPTYTGDLAQFLLELCEKRVAKGVYHYANSGTVSWHELACAIRDELGIKSCEVIPVTSDRFPRPAQRPKNSSFDLTKAESVSKDLIRSWREALGDYLREELL
jgi:dTDP-4-dehydrorhamnose reductase